MAIIIEDYVSFEVAKLLKEKGFNEECEYFYDEYDNGCVICSNGGSAYNDDKHPTYYSMPTLQMAMRWLRKKHLLHIPIDMMNGGRWEYEINDISVPFDGGVIPKYYCDKTFSSYEEAADDAIKYCLENLI